MELNVCVDENNWEIGIREILGKIRPEWINKISFKILTDGITNKLIKCIYNDIEGDKEISNVVLVRIYGNNTDLLIDRDAEKKNIKILYEHNLAPNLHATFKNGLCYDFVPGNTLDSISVSEPKIWKLVAKKMALMHKLPLPNDEGTDAMLKTKTLSFLDLIPEQFTDCKKHERVITTFPPVSQLREEFNELYAELEKLNSPVLFCHNDLLLGNVIYTEELQQVTFIDFEYAELNHQAFDIGNHFAEFPGIGSDSTPIDYSKYPSREFQLEWLRVYLEEFRNTQEISEDDVEALYKQVNKFALGSHFLWTCWSLIQAEHSTIDFDFISFGACRYNEYLSKKEEFLKL